MASLMIHGFVQMWNRNIGLSKSKEAFIETVDGKKVKLKVYFKSGGRTTIQLNNNIKNVFHRSYGDNQDHLHLIFKNNSFLFVERLSSGDAKELKGFLDKVHERKLQPSLEQSGDVSVRSSPTEQDQSNKTSPGKDCQNSSSESSESEEGNGAVNLQPLFSSIASTLICSDLENQCEKRKLSSDSEVNENTIDNGNESGRHKKSKKNPFRCGNHGEKTEWRKISKLDFKPSFKFKSTGNPYLDGIGLLQTLTEKIQLAFLSQAKYKEDDPEWAGLEIALDFYPEKLWQGLPNLGNTCYMNAVLQSLFSIPPFANDLLSWGFPWGKTSLDALSMCLAQLLVLKDIYNIKIKEKLLVNIKTAISAVAEIYSGNIQNDAHEFLGHCLDQMKENVGKFNNIQDTQKTSEEENPPQQTFAGGAAAKVSCCPVITNFEFELLCSIICKTCGHVVLKTDQSNYLSVNLPQGPKARPLSIQSTFDLFFKAEELEYKCEKCKHRLSIALHKFSRLPRVLIVHLKRYTFSEYWSLQKDDQEVVISKYLSLSSHCNGNTKPPLPLGKNLHVRNLQVFKVFQKMTSKAIRLSKISKKLALKSKNFLAPRIGLTKESEPQKVQISHKKSSKEKQQEPLVPRGVRTKVEKESLAADSVINEKDPSLALIREGESTSTPGACFAEIYMKELLENSLPTKLENDLFKEVNGENVPELTKDAREDETKKVAEQKHQQERMKFYEQALQQAFLQTFQKPDPLCCTENLQRPAGCRYQGANANTNSRGASDSNKSPSKKDFLGMGKTEAAAAKKPNGNAKGGKHTYRLIGIVSHLGKTPNSGHYISDAYDFERQVWFTYNDLQVSSIQEAPMQAARLCTGYIFFYMHNDIFEELLGRKENAQPCRTEAGVRSQEK